MEFYYQAFLELSFDRQVGFGEGRIPTSSILAYSRHFELNSEEEDGLLYFVRELDNAYLTERAKQDEKKKKQAENEG